MLPIVILLLDCPIGDVDEFRVEVLVRLRKLEKLDKDEFTDDERADAEEVTILPVYTNDVFILIGIITILPVLMMCTNDVFILIGIMIHCTVEPLHNRHHW